MRVSVNKAVDEEGAQTTDEATGEAAGGGGGDSRGSAVRNYFRVRIAHDLLSTLKSAEF